MAYIGNSPANIGNYQIVDDIASGFNGSLVSFALASGGIAITPAKSGQILANINGVMQEPDDGGTNGFKVTGRNIVFSSAPANGDTFWAVYQGQNVDIGTPSDDVVDTAHIKDDAVTAAKLANSINTAIAANTAKTGITTSQASAITANTAKTGITSSQSSAITANTAKTGITSSQATAITAALPKAGGTMTGNLIISNATPASIIKDTDTNNTGVREQNGTDLYYGNSSGSGTHIFKNNSSNGGLPSANGTELMRIDGSGNVLVGTSVTGRPNEGADRLTIADSGHSGLTIRSGTGSYGSINFSDSEGGTGEYAGAIWYGHGGLGEKLVIAIEGSNRLTVDGDGIKFNNDTAAANALSDYEEGTWTPVVIGGTQEVSVQKVTYTKIGRLVTLNVYVGATSVSDSTSFALSGLPFAAPSNGYNATSICQTATASTTTAIIARTRSSTSNLDFYYSGSQVGVPQSGFHGHLIFSITYATA